MGWAPLRVKTPSRKATTVPLVGKPNGKETRVSDPAKIAT
jgi:hypothetical protein